MTYKAITSFTDMQDNGYAYNAGDTFPRVGLSVNEDRINELLGSKNRRGEPVIAAIVVEGYNISSEAEKAATEDESDHEGAENAEVLVPAKRRRRGRRDG